MIVDAGPDPGPRNGSSSSEPDHPYKKILDTSTDCKCMTLGIPGVIPLKENHVETAN